VLAAFVGIAAAGQTMVALLGGIDLSIPGVIALANIATAQLTGLGWPFWQVALLLLGAGARDRRHQRLRLGRLPHQSTHRHARASAP
jgi:hypothetical protein